MNLMEIYTEMEHGINIWLQKEGTSQLEWPPKGESHCTNSEKKQPCAESSDKRENYVTWSCVFMESSSKHHCGRDILCCSKYVRFIVLTEITVSDKEKHKKHDYLLGDQTANSRQAH